MLVVVDTNIIVASLIKKYATRKLLISSNIDFVVPEWVHSEIREHIAEIAAKAKVQISELEHFVEEIFQVVQTVPFDEYEDCLSEALDIMKDIDRDDAPFLAVAIAVGADAIWSNDRDFESQTRIPVLRTEDLLKRSKRPF